MENSLVVAGHGLSDAAALCDWFSEHVCEVAQCVPLPGSGRSPSLVELFVENEIEFAEKQFSEAFPSASVRRASPGDYEAATLGGNSRCGQEGGRAPTALEYLFGGAVSVSLVLPQSAGGGTGARLWSGGVLLSEWLARSVGSSPLLPPGFSGKDVLELGAGCAALPATCAARLGARSVVATDLLADVVAIARENVLRNAPSVEVRTLDWSAAGRAIYPRDQQFDVVLFADAIYTERGASLLAGAATALLRQPHGVLVGALPDFRVGIASFEEDLHARGWVPSQAKLDGDLLAAASWHLRVGSGKGVTAGGSFEGYRIVVWRQRGDGDAPAEVARIRHKARLPAKRKRRRTGKDADASAVAVVAG